jgi:hypothetical protein
VTTDLAVLLGLLAAGLAAAGCAWWPLGHRWGAPTSLGLLAAAAAWAGVSGAAAGSGTATTLLVMLLGLLAVVGGGPVTTAVFTLVDGPARGRRGVSVLQAGQLLRGGAWIGALERGGVALSLLAGWPEGVAVVLAVKGLGRYPELRTAGTGAVAERFIIGTFASVLWAASCAALATLVV